MKIAYIREFVQEKWRQQPPEIRGCETVIEEREDVQGQPLLEELLEELQPGDVLVVRKLYSLANSTKHLIEICRNLKEKQAALISIEDSIDTRGDSFFQHLEQIANFRKEVVGERTKAGLSAAKSRNRTGGRPRKPDRNVQKAIDMYRSKKYTIADITIETGISKTTLYRYLQE
ncbi:Site-specific DNA recombinase [Terribacillus halophilus]|uniref:Site-specific DNA recombinase n=1 Tax=Terribacillus halophilus TaxID=361279 RepID=A0A1G6TCZ0_9BACI|nr:recombinase family protein [Terribacillus halophilus]SDD26406.1 Site-specific DNA recombinase [Terribacillus halophilus]